VHPKEAMNRGLSRAIGYTLVKAETLRNQRAKLERTQARLERKAARLERTQVKLERAQAKLDRTQARLERTQAALEKAKRPAKPDVPRHLDDEAKEIVRAVRDRTMTGTQKVFALIEATRYVLDTGVPGAIVECGVWRGGSMQAVALALLRRGVSDRDLHLYDTFEGMSEPTEEDRAPNGTPAAELLATRPKTARLWAVADLDDVRAGMAETGYPAERIHYHVGRVEDTIPAEAPEQIAVLRLDTDWYESTRHELEHLFDRVPSGGVVIVDDYGTWKGARRAVDEFLERTDTRLLLVSVGEGRLTLKP
jgi:O-methyltransferase